MGASESTGQVMPHQSIKTPKVEEKAAQKRQITPPEKRNPLNLKNIFEYDENGTPTRKILENLQSNVEIAQDMYPSIDEAKMNANPFQDLVSSPVIITRAQRKKYEKRKLI